MLNSRSDISIMNQNLRGQRIKLVPTLMAVWPIALPMTASCLSPLTRFESLQEHVRKLPVTWGEAMVFAV